MTQSKTGTHRRLKRRRHPCSLEPTVHGPETQCAADRPCPIEPPQRPCPPSKANAVARPVVWDPELDPVLENFGRVCKHFLSSKDRAKDDPRPGTFLFNWAVADAGGKVGAGLLLSHLVYWNQVSYDRETYDERRRLKPCKSEGLRDEDLNDHGAEFIRRPFLVNYESMRCSLGLSERQVVDAIRDLRYSDLVEKHKVPGHRGAALVLEAEYHYKLGVMGKLDARYKPHPDQLEWRTLVNASEVIAMPRLTHAVVLARWLRWMQWRKRKQPPENTHGQIAQQLGLSERRVQRTMKTLLDEGVLKPNYVKKRIRSQWAFKIPSPMHGRQERESLTRMTVEALAKQHDLPRGLDLSAFWKNDRDE